MIIEESWKWHDIEFERAEISLLTRRMGYDRAGEFLSSQFYNHFCDGDYDFKACFWGSSTFISIGIPAYAESTKWHVDRIMEFLHKHMAVAALLGYTPELKKGEF